MHNTATYTSQKLLAFVGMPGSGKTEAALYLKEKGYAYVRFGDVTEEILREKGIPLTPENEQSIREEVRSEFGMAAYAIKSVGKIENYLDQNKTVVIDGLYSWEEYRFLQNKGFSLCIIQVFADKKIRYERLAKRAARPLSIDEAKERDIAEIEKLNKGGPIAIADYLVMNNETKQVLFEELDRILEKINL